MTVVALCCALLLGCKTGVDASALQTKDDDEVNKMTSTDDVHGPLERFVSAAGWGKSDKEKKLHLVNPPEAMDAYHKAEEQMKAKKYKEAEDAFWDIAKKWDKFPIREDAAFMSGEAAFMREHYPTADDRYGLVVKEYQTTRHLDEISRRRFEIAKIWLGFPDIVTAKDVQPVNFEAPSSTPAPQTAYQEPSGVTYRVPIFPNFTDDRRPLFDTQGRALDSLKSIWLNDPTGPLADDALMLSASYYLRKGDYVEADHLYELLRKEFPKSPHLENAYVLGAHVKLMSYQGPEYDGGELDEARKLKETTLKLYPNRPDRARIEADLKRIEKAKAARVWESVKYWKSKAKPKAVAIYCKKLLKEFPNSDYATLAREELAKIRPEDKREANHQYEEKGGKAAVGDEPNVFNDPSSPPKSPPEGNGNNDAGRAHM